MKKLLFVILIFFIWVTSIYALSFRTYTKLVPTINSGGVEWAWPVNYDIAYEKGTTYVDLDLYIRKGTINPNWENDVESFWSKPGYNINIDFVTSSDDFNYWVEVVPGYGAPNMRYWWSDLGWREIAHEVGHMFGMYDEYGGNGALNPVTKYIGFDGIMGSILGTNLDRYYEVFDEAIASLNRDQPVPEPATIFLVGSGMIGLITFARRKFK